MAFVVSGNIENEVVVRDPEGAVIKVPGFVGETPGEPGVTVCPPGPLVALVEGNGGGTMVLAPGIGMIDVLLTALPVAEKDALGVPDENRLIEVTSDVPEGGFAVNGVDEEPVAGAVPGRVDPVSPADAEVLLETGKGAGELETLELDVEAPCGAVVKGGIFVLSNPVEEEVFPGVEVEVLLSTGVENPWPPRPGIGVLEEGLADESEPVPTPPLGVADSGPVGLTLAVELEVGNGGSG